MAVSSSFGKQQEMAIATVIKNTQVPKVALKGGRKIVGPSIKQEFLNLNALNQRQRSHMSIKPTVASTISQPGNIKANPLHNVKIFVTLFMNASNLITKTVYATCEVLRAIKIVMGGIHTKNQTLRSNQKSNLKSLQVSPRSRHPHNLNASSITTKKQKVKGSIFAQTTQER